MEEWLGEFGLRESEEWFLEWPKALGKIAIAFQGLEKKLRPKLMEPIFGTVIAGISELLYQGQLNIPPRQCTKTGRIEHRFRLD